jgi:hypothetical protein
MIGACVISFDPVDGQKFLKKIKNMFDEFENYKLVVRLADDKKSKMIQMRQNAFLENIPNIFSIEDYIMNPNCLQFAHIWSTLCCKKIISVAKLEKKDKNLKKSEDENEDEKEDGNENEDKNKADILEVKKDDILEVKKDDIVEINIDDILEENRRQKEEKEKEKEKERDPSELFYPWRQIEGNIFGMFFRILPQILK